MLASNCMALGPQNMSKQPFFVRKMSGLRMFSEFREHEVRRNSWYHSMLIPRSKGLQWMLASNCMALGPQNMSRQPFFVRKMSGPANVFRIS